MTQFGTVEILLSGDIGGNGVSRVMFRRSDNGTIIVNDCNSAGAALHTWWSYNDAGFPPAVSYTVNPEVTIRDSVTGAVSPPITMTSIPLPFNGTGSGDYAAGVGIRIDWLTGTLRGRRLMQGSMRMVPCTSVCYTTTGGITTSTVSSVITGATTYLSALAAANLVPVVWHRPAKGTFTGGLIADVVGCRVPSTPTGLRSRRS